MRALHGVAAIAAAATVLACAQRPAEAQEAKPFSEGMAFLSAKGFQRWISSGSPHAEAWLRAHPQYGRGVVSQPQRMQVTSSQPRNQQTVRIAPERRAAAAPIAAKKPSLGVPTGAPKAARESRLRVAAERVPTHTQGVEELLGRIDTVHYFAAQDGLEDASASVEVLTVPPSLEALKATATIQYAWKRPGVSRFVVTGLPAKARSLDSEVLALLKSQGRHLLAPSAKDFAADFQVSYTVVDGLYRLTGSARSPDSDLRRFTYWIRPNGQFVRRLYETKATRELHTSITYRAVEGGVVIAAFYAATVPVPEQPKAKGKSKGEAPPAAKPASFWSGTSAVRRVIIDHERVGDAYVPVAMASVPVRGDTQPLSLRLSDYRLNTGVEDAFFKGTGVAGSWR